MQKVFGNELPAVGYLLNIYFILYFFLYTELFPVLPGREMKKLFLVDAIKFSTKNWPRQIKFVDIRVGADIQQWIQNSEY